MIAQVVPRCTDLPQANTGFPNHSTSVRAAENLWKDMYITDLTIPFGLEKQDQTPNFDLLFSY